jgi:hypothetical protein
MNQNIVNDDIYPSYMLFWMSLGSTYIWVNNIHSNFAWVENQILESEHL